MKTLVKYAQIAALASRHGPCRDANAAIWAYLTSVPQALDTNALLSYVKTLIILQGMKAAMLDVTSSHVLAAHFGRFGEFLRLVHI